MGLSEEMLNTINRIQDLMSNNSEPRRRHQMVVDYFTQCQATHGTPVMNLALSCNSHSLFNK
jgi:hypothetical protein